MEEAEPRSLHHSRCSAEAVGSEEDSRSKDAFKSGYQAAVFLAAFVHAESLQHFSRSSDADRLALLPGGNRRQINRYDSILTRWQPVVRVTSNPWRQGRRYASASPPEYL